MTKKTIKTSSTTEMKKRVTSRFTLPKVNTKGPEFKPGNTPHLQYGKEVLNANVDWNELVNDIIAKRYSKSKIAEYAQCEPELIDEVLDENYEGLNFRTGARLVTLHYKLHPMCYA